MTTEATQLHMRRSLQDLPDLRVPGGYTLRPLARADVEAWTRLLDENGGFGPWPPERSLPLFAPRSPIVFAGSYLLVKDGVLAATAQLHHQTRRSYAPPAELGWVAVHPRHQGRGLARVVCLAVLRYAASAGYRDIFLRTEDHRLPAIRTYLKLGFEPWLVDPSAPGRWDAILSQLDDDQRRRREARRGTG
jgi:mycothiol synthase